MITLNRKHTLYIFREICLRLIDIYDENYEVYFYISLPYNELIYISTNKVDLFLEVKIGKMPLIKLFIHTLIQEYPQVSVTQLVIIAFRVIRRYSHKQLASIFNCTVDQYVKLEAGYNAFVDKFSFEEFSNKLDIPKELFISESCFILNKYLEQ